MSSLIDVVKKLRERIKRYRDLLARNEVLTRYVLIDPLFRALGWDTEDPEKVRPEERLEEERIDYALYVEGRKLLAVEAKALGTSIDEEKALDLGFKYSWRHEIPYFAITDGDRWIVYSVEELGGKRILSTSISREDPEVVAEKLSRLQYDYLVQRKEIESIPEEIEEKLVQPEIPIERPEQPSTELDLNKVRKFYESLTPAGKAMLKIVYRAWREGRALTKDEIIEEMNKTGFKIDRIGFTGVKSGITRRAKKMGLPPPMPSEPELGYKGYHSLSGKEKYILKDEWGRALEKVLANEFNKVDE